MVRPSFSSTAFLLWFLLNAQQSHTYYYQHHLMLRVSHCLSLLLLKAVWSRRQSSWRPSYTWAILDFSRTHTWPVCLWIWVSIMAWSTGNTDVIKSVQKIQRSAEVSRNKWIHTLSQCITKSTKWNQVSFRNYRLTDGVRGENSQKQ